MKLYEYREQIDAIDRQIIQLLAARNKLVRETAFYKKGQQMPIFDMKRWKEMLRTRSEMAMEYNLDRIQFKRIYLSILRMALQIESVI